MSEREYKYIVNDTSAGGTRKKLRPRQKPPTLRVYRDRGVWSSYESYSGDEAGADTVLYDEALWYAIGNVPQGAKPAIGSKYWGYIKPLSADAITCRIEATKTVEGTLLTARSYVGETEISAEVSKVGVWGWRMLTEAGVKGFTDNSNDSILVRSSDLPREGGAFVYVAQHSYYKLRAEHTVVKPSDPRAIVDEVSSVIESRVGAKNLLREYDIRFKFRYWRGTGKQIANLTNHDLKKYKYLVVSPSSVVWATGEYESELNVKSNVKWNIE